MSTPWRKRGDLRSLADAAVDGGDAQRHGFCQWLQRGHDLIGQLAGGYEDEGSRPAGFAATAACRETGDDRQGECDGLAAAGLAAAEHVVAEKGVGKRCRLDREGGQDIAVGEDLDQRGRHAEGDEVGDVIDWRSWLLAVRRRMPCWSRAKPDRWFARSVGAWCRPPLRRRAPRLLEVDVVIVGDSFMGCWPWMQRPTTRWNHCALRSAALDRGIRVRTPPSNRLPLNWPKSGRMMR